MLRVEKYYCEKCRLLYNEEKNCPVCGTVVDKKIRIEVQKQADKN